MGIGFSTLLMASMLMVLPLQTTAQEPIRLAKSGPEFAELGGTITYTFEITNPGDLALEFCLLEDSMLEIREAEIEGSDIPHVLEVDYDLFDPPSDGSNRLTNIATLFCTTVDGDEVETSDQHVVEITNLPGASITLDKSGPLSADVGETIAYSFSLTKTGETAVSGCLLNDPRLGISQPINVNESPLTFPYTVNESDVGQLLNDASVTCEVAGGGQIEATDQHAVSVVDPSVVSITLEKSGPEIVKVGDTITYDFLLSKSGEPELVDCILEDSMLGERIDINVGELLQLTYVTSADDDEQLENFATVSCQVEGGNTVEASDDHFVDIVNASITLDKSGPSTVKLGHDIAYAFLLTNTGDEEVDNCILNDPMLGIDQGIEVDEVVEINYPTSENDPDPINNTAQVTCNVGRFEITVMAEDSHTVDLLRPSVELTKQCAPNPVLVGNLIEWAISVDNTGDFDLECTVIDEPAGVNQSVSVLKNTSEEIVAGRIVSALDFPLISNHASVDCVAADFSDHPPLNETAGADCEVWEITEICRPSGFWATHSGTEKSKSRNLTQDVLHANGGSLYLCGDLLIDNTDLGPASSALEALCVATTDAQQQLIRQLTAAALNCIVSGSDDTCLGMSVEADFAAANAACANDSEALSDHIDRIDCFNNGGEWVDYDAEPFCAYSTPGCQELALVESAVWADEDSKIPGPAGSPKLCNAAKKN